MNTRTCPLCEMGQLTVHHELVLVEHLGRQSHVKSRYAICDCCGSEQAGVDEVRFNKRAMIACYPSREQ